MILSSKVSNINCSINNTYHFQQYLALSLENRMNIESKVAARTHINKDIKFVIIGIGPIRSGTTLFLRIFAETGIHSWYQPFKAILRGYLHNNVVELIIDKQESGIIFIKETLGPYTQNEVSLNSIDVLLKAGIEKEKIILLNLVREPFSTLASSIVHFTKFKERENISDIILNCYDSILKIDQYAKNKAIKTISFVYDAWNNNNSLEILEKLFLKMDLPFAREKLMNWKTLESLVDNPFIHNLFEPAIYHHTDFSNKVKNYRNVSYSSGVEDDIKNILTPSQIEQIKNSRAPEIYNHFRKQTEIDLDIEIEKQKFFHL